MPDPMDMIGGAIADRAVGVTNNAITGLINMVITRGVDYFMGETKEERKKRIDEYYSRVKTIVDEHQRVTPLFSSNGELESDFGFQTPQQRAMQELDEVDTNLMSAVKMIETARDKSRCGICKSKLDETLKIVKDNTVPIFDATDKIRAIQQLKSEGKLDPNVLWEVLTPDQKRIVERIAKDISKAREERTLPLRIIPLARGPPVTGEEEVEIDISRRTPRKPRAPRAKASKPRATPKRATPKRATPKRAPQKRATPKRKKSYPV